MLSKWGLLKGKWTSHNEGCCSLYSKNRKPGVTVMWEVQCHLKRRRDSFVIFLSIVYSTISWYVCWFARTLPVHSSCTWSSLTSNSLWQHECSQEPSLTHTKPTELTWWTFIAIFSSQVFRQKGKVKPKSLKGNSKLRIFDWHWIHKFGIPVYGSGSWTLY